MGRGVLTTPKLPQRRTGILERVLERWELEAPSTPTAEALHDLHRAYLARVPFENVTKLIKAARAMSPQGAVRGPVEFWEDYLRWGSGGTCFAATYAYQFLLRYLGFRSHFLFCRLPAEKPHAHGALLVEAENARWLVDVGYALPLPVRVPTNGPVRQSTPFYDLEVRRGPGQEVLVFTEDDRGQRFRYQAPLRPIPESIFLNAWQETFHLGAPYMRRLALGRFRPDARYLYKKAGYVFAINRTGERMVPLDGPPVKALSDFFVIPEPLVNAAFNALGRLRGLRPGI